MSSSGSQTEIDEDLQSRQLAVYGKVAMGRLRECNVLISGINGLGAEIAKNVILANVNSVTLHDTSSTTAADLGSHFYLRETDIGTNRATASVARLQELNPGVRVSELSGELTIDRLAAFQAVVLIESSEEFAVAADEFCRSQAKPIAFLRTDVNGLFGRLFVDLGPEFVVVDTTGEPPKTAIVTNILSDGHVACVEEDRLDFEEGDLVRFTEVGGMVELNDDQPRRIINIQAHSFDLAPEAAQAIKSYSPYTKGGIVTQVKVPKPLHFRSLREVLADMGEPLISDFSKLERPAELHLLYRALDAFRTKHEGQLPRAANDEDASSLVAIAKELAGSDGEVNERLARALAHGARAVLNPMAALYGGIVGQEVIKAATGKFHPVFQSFYFESLECLPNDEVPAEERQPRGSRYDAQIIVFGSRMQAELEAQRVFLVGSGALGCEFLKNMSLMGVGASEHGLVTVTDDDTIERSNLSRQFLFRNWHIGKAKSLVAAEAAREMNAAFRVRPLQDRVSPNTENVFDDDFWHSLTCVCNALDNVSARRYVDSRCVFFLKPLLESGTLGTKCNTQVVLPHESENYGASNDPPEKVTPDCTLHNFPHNIQHCLSWARSEYIGNFEVLPSETIACLKAGDGAAYVESLKRAGNGQGDVYEKLLKVSEALSTRPSSFEDCIAWARLRFEDYFTNRIKQLTFTFARDATTSSGLPFWAPPKRFPTPLAFDAADPEHMRFIMAAANLRARIFGITPPETPGNADAVKRTVSVPDGEPSGNRDPAYFADVLSRISVPAFEPKSGVKIKVDEKEQTQEPNSNELADVLERLPRLEADELARLREQLAVEEFEKDHDWNFHMDFIGSVGNLRARNYEIAEVDALQAKLVAGRIIPAIATTTALATGFVMLEFYKIVNKKRVGSWDRVGDYRNAYANLALPLFSFSDPTPPARIVARTERRYPDPIKHPEYYEEEEIAVYPPEGFTAWDRVEIRIGDCTLRELQQHLKTAYGVSLCSLTVSMPDGRAAMLFHSAMRQTLSRLDTKISTLYVDVGKGVLTRPYIVPSCYLTNDDGNDVDFPMIILHLDPIPSQ